MAFVGPPQFLTKAWSCLGKVRLGSGQPTGVCIPEFQKQTGRLSRWERRLGKRLAKERLSFCNDCSWFRQGFYFFSCRFFGGSRGSLLRGGGRFFDFGSFLGESWIRFEVADDFLFALHSGEPAFAFDGFIELLAHEFELAVNGLETHFRGRSPGSNRKMHGSAGQWWLACGWSWFDRRCFLCGKRRRGDGCRWGCGFARGGAGHIRDQTDRRILEHRDTR